MEEINKLLQPVAMDSFLIAGTSEKTGLALVEQAVAPAADHRN